MAASWSFVRKSSNAAKLQSLAFPVDCPRAEPAYQSYHQGQNGRKIIQKKRVVKYPKSKNLLNHNFVLDSKELNSFLSVTKNIDALCDSKFLAESTLNCCVCENCDVSGFDPETDEIIRNLDLKNVMHPSPSQSSYTDHLFLKELENSNSPLPDIFNTLSSERNSMIYDVNQKFDFTAGFLNP